MNQDMKIINSECRVCPCCMEEHAVKTVVINESTSFKGEKISYNAVYLYCENEEELYMDEKQISENDLALKDAYRRQTGLLTMHEIRSIRQEYGVSQTDFAALLGWGLKTITRYEGHQVQDRAHDMILRKVAQDPAWFLTLLSRNRTRMQKETYAKYFENAVKRYEKYQDIYRRLEIEAGYTRFQEQALLNGNTKLDLDKTVEMICYFAASSAVTNLYKVKLMKLLWYADMLAYKERGRAISGLIYKAFPMGAVPIEHDALIRLKGVPCREIEKEDATAYYFHLAEKRACDSLGEDEQQILDRVIQKIGGLSRSAIVDFMHQEKAYTQTGSREFISFLYAKDLRI